MARRESDIKPHDAVRLEAKTMNCSHDRLRCTNNVFFCLKCGAQVPSPYEADKHTTETAKPSEAPKRAAKRTTKKKE